MTKTPSTFKTLGDLTAGHRRYAAVILAVMVLAALSETVGLSMIFPVLSGLMGSQADFTGALAIFNRITKPFPAQYALLVQLGVMVLAVYTKNLLAVLLRGMSAHFAMKLRELWSVKLLYRHLRDDYEHILDMKQGAALHNNVMEPFHVAKSILVLLNLLTKLILALGLLAMLVSFDWKVTLALVGVGGFMYLATQKWVYSYSVKFGKKRLSVSQDINTVAAESLGAAKEVKILGLEGSYKSEMRKHLALFRKIQTRFSVLNQLPENLIETCAITGVVLVVAYVRYGYEGDVASVLSKAALFIMVGQKLFNCLSYVISQRMKFTSSMPGLALIHKLIMSPENMEQLDKGQAFDIMTDDILLKDVCFGYGSAKEGTVLDGVSMRIPLGKMTAIVGPSGAGKSTIADLLMGLLHPQQGGIFVNGRNLKDYSLASWRKKVGYVGQTPVVFNTTIRANIAAGKPGASQAEIEQAARTARIHDFVTRLPGGYDTLVGDRGAKLSGGQRQRLVIARAILRNPELFIFDEATSSLDKETEADITRAMEELAGRKTLVVIAHRLSTIKNADVVYDLSKMQTKPFFKEEPGE